MAKTSEELKQEANTKLLKLVESIDTKEELGKLAGFNEKVLDTYLEQGNLSRLVVPVSKALHRQTSNLLPSVRIKEAAATILRNVQQAETSTEEKTKPKKETANKPTEETTTEG